MKHIAAAIAAFSVAAAAVAADEGSVKALLDEYVEKGGVVSGISDASGEVRFDCAGWADMENKVPISTNTLFAVFSMTKTFNGAALMAAIDDGRLSLDDEVAKFLPEFADIKVSVTDAEGKKSLVPPKRPLTIRDLVTHTSGSRFSPPIIKRAVPLREIARQMAAVPLVAQPGETFCYGNAWVDASAAALEVAVGMPYEKWLKERVLDPLGMGDTTFSPTAEQASRIVKAYTTDDGPLRLGSDWCTPQLVFPWETKVFPCAAGGLFSTPADMMRFSQMLAHHGTWKGRKIISEHGRVARSSRARLSTKSLPSSRRRPALPSRTVSAAGFTTTGSDTRARCGPTSARTSRPAIAVCSSSRPRTGAARRSSR